VQLDKPPTQRSLGGRHTTVDAGGWAETAAKNLDEKKKRMEEGLGRKD